ncbi:MAG: tetratricopeptide repeat protein, partial [Chthoniobacterales bacterium]
MDIRKIVTITLLVLSSFAANNVAPSKAELEAMYDKAFREFNANNYPQALKALDAIDARQPDLAESQNLRGVIAMREGNYDQAEQALQKALAADPKFWNARFNLAEIPFLKKNWTEARNRFEALLSGNKAELQGEALQLIQYKILLTYLLEGKENMVDSIRAKLELSSETPAIHYANAAIALQRKNETEAKDSIAAAEKDFSPQLNKLFVESLYEVGWLQKPAGQTRAALELTSSAERAAKTKAFARAKFEQAEQAFQQRDLTAAKKLVNEADAADPNQAPTLNLRGEILLAQKDFDAAEGVFKQALKADPKMHEAAFNLAQIPFKKKEYPKARDRFEALLNTTSTSDGDKSQAAQLIKFQIYLTFLLEGKDSRAQKLMEQFQFTGDTPALYYAQAAWEFKHNNQSKANDWVASARKIYSPAMNMVFADGFYDVGWLQNQAASPAPAVADAKVDVTPSIEPSPIPGATLAANSAAKLPANTAPEKSPPSTAPIQGMAATTANGEPAAVTIAQASPGAKQTISTAPLAELSPGVETPTASNASPAETRVAKAPEPQQSALSSQSVQSAAPPIIAQTTISATPSTVLAPAAVREWSQPTFGERVERFVNVRSLLFSGLLLAGLVIIAWVVVHEVRRQRVANVPIYRPAAPATGPRFTDGIALADEKKIIVPIRFVGGPP